MKRKGQIVAWIAIGVLALIHVVCFVHGFSAVGTMHGPNNSLMEGLDLSLRRNEAACVLAGVNPYDVWAKKIVRPPYFPFTELGRVGPEFTEPVNAYTPWEYVAAFPYACLPKQTAWYVHTAIMIGALAFIVWFAGRLGGAASLLAVLCFVIPVNVDLNCGNYALIITAVTIGLLRTLDRGERLWPILFWAIAMFKPQTSVLLAIPLILKRQWLVGIGTATLCFALSLVPACMCHASVVDLILQAPAASAHGFTGCALMPEPLLDVLKGVCPATVWMGVSMLCGIAICLLLTWRLRESRSWFILALPALVCAASWTYVTQHGYVLMTVVAALLASDMVRNGTPGRLWLGIPAILLWARFARGAEIVAERLVPACLPIAGFFCRISATVALAFTIIYFWRYAETLKQMRVLANGNAV